MWLSILVICAVCFTAVRAQTEAPTAPPTVAPTDNISPTASPSQSNWQATPLPFKLTNPLNGKRIAAGYNGQNVAIATPYGIYASTDYGNTFSWTNADLEFWSSITSDSSGNNMYALNNNGMIYYTYGALKTGWTALPYSYTGYSDIATDSTGVYLYAINSLSSLSSYCTMNKYKNQFYTNYYSLSIYACNKVIVDSTSNNILVMGAYANQIGLSTNGGSTFTVYKLPYSLHSPFPVVATSYSATNSYVFVANGGQAIQISTNQGVTFSSATTVNSDFHNATMLASSGTGQYVVFGGFTKENTDDAEIWLSSDYGATFSTAFPTTSNEILGGVVSSTGSSIYVLAGQYLYSYQQTPQSPMPTFMPTSAPTKNWLTTPITANTGYGFSAIALNNDGSCITVGATDGTTLFARQTTGGTFTQWTSSISSNTPFTSISMSINGQYQIALNANSSVYLSSNSGLSWTRTSDSLNYNNAQWRYSAMSDNGYIILLSQSTSVLAVYNGDPSGTWSPTFTISQPFNFQITGVAMDHTGQTFAVMNAAGYLYITTNQGALWFPKSSPLREVFSMTTSRTNLNTIVAAMYARNLVSVSTNEGVSFATAAGPGAPTNFWWTLSSSYSGQYVVGTMTSGPYDSSTAQDGVYYSSNNGQSWTFIQPLGNAVAAINPAGNLMVAVSADVGSTQLYYYSQAVPTAAPTLHPPTMQPTMTNAPYNPISTPIVGWVTRNQYQASGSTCSGTPLTVAGYKTNTCLITTANPTVLAVMYTCDKDSIVMTEYADESCSTQLSTSKSYVNGQEYLNEYNQCVTKLTCDSSSSVSSSLAGNQYSTTQYYSDTCMTPVQYQALLENTCIPTDANYAASTGIYSVYATYPNIFEYTYSSTCSGFSTVSTGSITCANVNYYSSVTYTSDTTTAATRKLHQSHVPQLPAILTGNSFSIGQDIQAMKYVKDEKKRDVSLRSTNGEPIADSSIDTVAYGLGDDDILGGFHYMTTVVNGPSDDDTTSMDSGAIAGSVIGSIIGFGILIAIAWVIFVNTCGRKYNPNYNNRNNVIGTDARPQPPYVNSDGVPVGGGPGVVYASNPGVMPIQQPQGGTIVYVMGPNNTMTPMMVPQQQGAVVYTTTNNPMYTNGAVPAVAVPVSNQMPQAYVVPSQPGNVMYAQPPQQQ